MLTLSDLLFLLALLFVVFGVGLFVGALLGVLAGVGAWLFMAGAASYVLAQQLASGGGERE